MADSVTNLDLVSASQAAKEVTMNAGLDSMSPASLFGRRATTTSALTWGLYGGKYRRADGTVTTIANSTVTLTASATNYILETDSVVSKVTAAPSGWPGPLASNAKALYAVVCDGSGPTSYTDYRTTAIGSGAGTGSGSVTSVNITPPAAGITAAGGPVTGSGAITLSLANDLAALEGLSGTGIAERTGTDTWTLLTLDTDTALAANSDTRIATQKATKAYVDASVAGLSWKQAVRAATTTAGTLATSFANGSAIDGVTLATGDRILVKNQATGSENGLYVVNASGAPTRSTDADSGAELVNASVYVSEGTTLADTQWTCSTNAPITVGTTSLAFAQLASGGGGTPGGSSTQVQFNDGGSFGGDADFTWDKTNNILYLGSAATPGIVSAPAAATSTSAGNNITVQAGAGGSTSGAAGGITISGGAPTDGNGGAVTISGTTAATTTSANRNGGGVSITGGDSTVGGNGGGITITGGAGSASTNVGAVTIKTGLGSGSYTTQASMQVSGGAVTLSAANGKAAGLGGGAVSISSGSGGTSNSAGGNVSITAGAGGTAASGNLGGTVTLTGGAGTSTTTGAAGSAVKLVGGAAAGTGNNAGGDVTFTGGAATGTGRAGNIVLNGSGSALATTATGGFACIPTCAGTPTGTPATVATGTVPMVMDSSNSKIYFYVGGSWKGVVVA